MPTHRSVSPSSTISGTPSSPAPSYRLATSIRSSSGSRAPQYFPTSVSSSARRNLRQEIGLAFQLDYGVPWRVPPLQVGTIELRLPTPNLVGLYREIDAQDAVAYRLPAYSTELPMMCVDERSRHSAANTPASFTAPLSCRPTANPFCPFQATAGHFGARLRDSKLLPQRLPSAKSRLLTYLRDDQLERDEGGSWYNTLPIHDPALEASLEELPYQSTLVSSPSTPLFAKYSMSSTTAPKLSSMPYTSTSVQHQVNDEDSSARLRRSRTSTVGGPWTLR